MIGSDPIASAPIAGDGGGETIYLPVSRITSPGIFTVPANVPVLLDAITWDDGTNILWDDGTLILWD